MDTIAFPEHRAFAEIDGAALCRNYRLLLQKAQESNPRARLIAVVKDDAYGHGLSTVLPLLLEAGCDFFAVATADEAFAVRGLAPAAEILVLGYTPPQKAERLAEARITQTVFSAAYGAALNAALSRTDRRLPIHVKLNGGLCRGGFDPCDAAGLRGLLSHAHLLPKGVYTHFSAADTDRVGTRRALYGLCHVAEAFQREGIPLFVHAAASAAALTLPETVLDGIRVGIALYGLPPVPTALPLTPTLSLHAPVVCLCRVTAGTPIGYGGDFVTERETLLGTLPIGYGDGLWRRLRTLTPTLSHESKRFAAPILGRICMDHTVVDLTDTPAVIGDTVCLWEDARAPALHADTIPYEILTALSSRVERRRK